MFTKRRHIFSPIAIDIGATAVRALQLAWDGRQPRLIGAAFEEIPRDAWAGSLRPDAVRVALVEALRRGKFHGRRAVTALSHGEYQIKSVRLPPMPAEEMASAVEFEALERFAIASDAAQFRHIPAGEVRHGNEIKQEIIVFAGMAEAIRERIALFESLRLQPEAIDAAPCAMARAFVRFLRRADDVHAVNVFVEMGYRSTCVVITHGTAINFLKVVELGGEHLNLAVSAALGIPTEEAGRLRLRLMRNNGGRRADDAAEVPEELQNTVGDAVRAPIERLIRELQLCLRYFAVTFRGERPTSITFVGGEAHEPQLTKLAAEAIDIPCTIGNPLRGIQDAGLVCGPDRRTQTPSWAVATGLAFYGTALIHQADGTLAGSARAPTNAALAAAGTPVAAGSGGRSE